MLRTAARFLLAVMLCLNGFGLPPAFANSAAKAVAGDYADGAAPCHEEKVIASDDKSGHQAAHAGKVTEDTSDSPCCAKGKCSCDCIVSAVLNVPLLPLMPHGVSARMPPADLSHFPLARASVLQRPPIA